jgi:hypothetical protein
LVHLGLGKAKLIGKHAKELFSAPDFSGRVLAVVSNAVYLETRFLQENGFLENEILWLTQNDVPMHPRALRGDFDFSALRVGMTFQSDGAWLRFDTGDHTGSLLHFVDARVWQPAMVDPARVAPREVIIARARELDPTGFAKPVRSLKDARALIGLGEGLTPSGDDFVGGLLFAVYHLRAAYPNMFHWEQRAIDDLLDYARARTNVISYALVRDHARGQSVEPLHDWIAAMLGVDEPGDIAGLVARLIGIGSTTGKNILAGAATRMFFLAAAG